MLKWSLGQKVKVGEKEGGGGPFKENKAVSVQEKSTGF